MTGGYLHPNSCRHAALLRESRPGRASISRTQTGRCGIDGRFREHGWRRARHHWGRSGLANRLRLDGRFRLGSRGDSPCWRNPCACDRSRSLSRDCSGQAHAEPSGFQGTADEQHGHEHSLRRGSGSPLGAGPRRRGRLRVNRFDWGRRNSRPRRRAWAVQPARAGPQWSVCSPLSARCLRSELE